MPTSIHSEDVDLLTAGFGRGDAVRFAVSSLGGIVARLAHAGSRAVVALQGAQVLSYVPAAGAEVLWLSPEARLGAGKAVRGGIPICWPWFGPHPLDPKAPAHGFVRVVDWIVVGSDSDDAHALLRLACPYPAEHRAAWRDAAELTLEVALFADRLGLTLTTRNLGLADLSLTEALHSYFAVSDIGGVAVEGHDGQTYIDKLECGAVKQQSGAVAFAGEVDRIYADDGPASTIVDPQLGRRIHLTKSDSRSTVIWNPWIDKSARLGDMGPDGYRRMVCVETANCGHASVIVAPGEMHRMSVEIAARPL